VSAASKGYNPDEYVLARPAILLPPTGVLPGQVRGRVFDPSGALLPGVGVQIAVGRYRASTVSDSSGVFVFSGLPHGDVVVTSVLSGFKTSSVTFQFDGRPRRVDIQMDIASITESVTVAGETALIDVRREAQAEPPSQNVVNLQARAAGVLPIRVDVPRAGVSHQFIKPLVVGTEATVTLRYKRR